MSRLNWKAWGHPRHPRVQNLQVTHSLQVQVAAKMPVKATVQARVEAPVRVEVQVKALVKVHMTLGHLIPPGNHPRHQLRPLAHTILARRRIVDLIQAAHLPEAAVVRTAKRTSIIRLREQGQTTKRRKGRVLKRHRALAMRHRKEHPMIINMSNSSRDQRSDELQSNRGCKEMMTLRQISIILILELVLEGIFTVLPGDLQAMGLKYVYCNCNKCRLNDNLYFALSA